MPKKIIKYILTFFIIFSIPMFQYASAYEITGFDINARSAMLISLDTGEVLYSKNENVKTYPASLTKILSAIIMIENTADIDSEKIVTTKSALRQISGTGATVIGLKVGEELTVRQALYCLLVSSGGDVSYAIAEHYGGTTENFMEMLNAKAAEIGMTSSHFGNPVGLHDDDTYTTAADIATLAKYALKYEIFRDVTSTRRYTLEPTNMSPARNLSTTNFLIDPSTNYYYQYASGVKTGFTDEAGRCVVSTASYSGYTYLCVIMGCDGSGGRRNEFVDSRNLYRWAFNNFEYKSILDTSKPITEIPVELSLDTDYVALYAETGITNILPKKADSSTIIIKPKLNSVSVEAPIKAGTVLGTADIIYSEEVIGTVNLIATENIDSDFILVVAKSLKIFFSSIVFKIIAALAALAVIIYIGACIKLNYRRKGHRKVKYIPYNKHDKNEK